MPQNATDLFSQVLRHPSSEWMDVMERLCGDDEALRNAVASYLSAQHEMPDDFLENRGRPPRETGSLPKRVGAYEILRPVNQGGMGTVYLGRRADGVFEKEVAVKLLSPELALVDFSLFAEQLRKETRIHASLEHLNIVGILDAGSTEEGTPYIVMEYVDGPDLITYCDQEKLGIRERLRLFQSVCSAIEYAHSRLVVHRDLKPANILVTKQGEPKILDFGIADIVGPRNSAPKGSLLRPFTPLFASPEQLRGETPGTMTDCYSLGIVLFELLAGQVPFDDFETFEELLEKKTSGDLPVPSRAVEDLPRSSPALRRTTASNRSTSPALLRRRLADGLDSITLAAMHPEASKRPTVSRLKDEIGRHLAHLPTTLHASTNFYRMRKFIQRHPVVAVAVLLAFTLLGTVSAWALRELQRTRQEAQWSEGVADYLGDVFVLTDPSTENAGQITGIEMVSAAVLELNARFEENQPIRALLQWRLAGILHQYGNYPEARSLYDESLAGITSHFGENSLERAKILNDRAIHLGDLGEVETAMGDLEESLQIKKRFIEPEDQESLVRTLINLGATSYQQGNKELSLQYFETALSILSDAEDSADWASGPKLWTESNLAAIETTIPGKESDGRKRLERVLESSKERYGDHPLTGYIYHNLGESAARGGQLREAVRFLSEALRIRNKLSGQPTIESHESQILLALVLSELGETAAAVSQQREAVEGAKRIFGPDHARTAESLRNLGILDRIRGDHGSSEVNLARAITIHSAIEDVRDQELPRTRAELALSLAAAGRGDEAREEFEKISEPCASGMGEKNWFQVLCEALRVRLGPCDGNLEPATARLEQEAESHDFELEMGRTWLMQGLSEHDGHLSGRCE